MVQPNLLDDANLSERILDRVESRRQAQAGERKAAQKAESPAGAAWKLQALQALLVVARRKLDITADDVWQEIGAVDARFGNMMGSVFKSAARDRVLVRTGRFVESQRPSRHTAGIRVWQSLICSQ